MGKIISRLVIFSAVLVLLVSVFMFLPYRPKDNCQGLTEGDRPSCLEREFRNILEKKGVVAGFNLLTFLYQKDASFPPICHDYMHLIGEESYKRYARGERFKLTDVAGSCGYGFYHGFIISLFQDGKGKNEASEFCDWADNTLSSQTATTSLDCYHGIGHGMVDFNLAKTPAGDAQKLLNQNLKLCHEFGASGREIGRCVNGVFHSALGIMSANSDFDALVFCNVQEEPDRNQCFSASSFFVMEGAGGDFSKSALLTQNSLEVNDAVLVIRGMAGYEAYRSVNNAQKIRDDIKVCQALQLMLKEGCIRGLVEGLTDYGLPGEEEKAVASFCRDVQFSQNESGFCLEHAADYFGDYFGAEKRSKLCGLIGPEYCF